MKDTLDVRKRSIFSSSAESLESYDDSLSITTQEQLYDNIRLHKEIIQSVKLQPWSLSKKYKIVQKAKQYVARHEDTLQERFAQSGNTKDLYARFKIVLADVRPWTTKKIIIIFQLIGTKKAPPWFFFSFFFAPLSLSLTLYFFSTEIQIFKAWILQLLRVIDSMGNSYQGNRVSLWISRRLIFHLPSMALLG